jgi:hypothetical protein
MENEPLIIGLTLCFTLCPPWQLRQSSRVLELVRMLQSMWALEEGREQSALCQLLALPWHLESL